MNALCATCPIGWICESFLPDADEANRKLQKRNYDVAQENSVLKKRMIEAGLECGASVWCGVAKK